MTLVTHLPCYSCASSPTTALPAVGLATSPHLNRTRKGHLTKADLAEGLRMASPSAFHHLVKSGSLESDLAEEFAAMDVNGDGVISFEEYKSALSRPPVVAH